MYKLPERGGGGGGGRGNSGNARKKTFFFQEVFPYLQSWPSGSNTCRCYIFGHQLAWLGLSHCLGVWSLYHHHPESDQLSLQKVFLWDTQKKEFYIVPFDQNVGCNPGITMSQYTCDLQRGKKEYWDCVGISLLQHSWIKRGPCVWRWPLSDCIQE